MTPPSSQRKKESTSGNMRRTFSVMSTAKNNDDKDENYDSFTQKIQNNQALQLNRGFMKRPTSGSLTCYFRTSYTNDSTYKNE